MIFVTTLICIAHFIVNAAAARHLLQGGGGGGGGGPAGGGGGGGGSIHTEYDFIIDISVSYNWEIINNQTTSFTLKYSTLWSLISNKISIRSAFDLETILDKTSNRNDLIHELFDANKTETFHLKIAVTSDSKTGSNNLKDYVNTDLANDIKSKFQLMDWPLTVHAVECTIKKAPNYGVLVTIVISSIVGFVFICGCCVWCICYKMFQKNGKESNDQITCTESPDKWVNDGKCKKGDELNDVVCTDPFIDGLYSGAYWQYRRNYDMQAFTLQFGDNGVVTGNGEDDVGEYKIIGIYSSNTQKMAFDKTYVRGTGNKRENLGHTVKIGLEYNGIKNQFEGKWYVETHKYKGNGEWRIKKCDNAPAKSKTTREGTKKYHTINAEDEEEVAIITILRS